MRRVRHRAGNHQEENDANGKNVNKVTSIATFFEDFGCLVHTCTDLRVVDTKAVAALLPGGESEICDFKVSFKTFQDIIRFQVEMNYSFVMNTLESK